MEQLLQAERLGLLELLAESDDPQKRDDSRAVAKWIKHFLGPIREYVVSMDDAIRNPVPEGDPEYMDYDSDSRPEGSNGSGRVPSGT